MTLRVSDHALVRWLERAHGIDMEFFRRRLEAELAPAFASGAVLVKRDGLEFCISGGVLTTVKPVKPRVVHRRARAAREEEWA